MVVLFHFFFQEDNAYGFLQNIIANGDLGVDLFFILSGFILTHVYLTQVEENRFSLRNFYVARFARIYPLHVMIILVFLIIYPLAGLLGVQTQAEAINWDHLLPPPATLITTLALFIMAGFLFNKQVIVLGIGLLIFLLGQYGLREKRNFMRSKVLVYLGKISFSIYMVHIIFRQMMNVVGKFVDLNSNLVSVLVYMTMFAGILVASMILYHLVELPFRQRIRHAFSK